MIVTEEEAKTKRCCGGPQCGNYEPIADGWRCIGSACMAWRWQMIDDGDSMHLARWVPSDKGYCGKAGRP